MYIRKGISQLRVSGYQFSTLQSMAFVKMTVLKIAFRSTKEKASGKKVAFSI
jgi:hypothetical protein